MSQNNINAGASGSGGSGAAAAKSGISRRKIIKSQSQQAGLNVVHMADEEEGDVWHDKDTLYAHHLKEVLDKWSDIDDEIWGKIICMEKNRRVAKAYARVPVLTINGSGDGFDGYRIGMCGFENAKRKPDTQDVQKKIGQGIKVKLDHEGNIFVKKITESPVFVRGTGNTPATGTCQSEEVLQLQGQLETGKPAKVFDMRRFIQNITQEMKGPYLSRRKLELQCITSITFGQNDQNHLESPCWLMVVNIVALDMLRSKLPEAVYAVPRNLQSRTPAMMENVSQARSFSTPRDEHYPRLGRQQQQAMQANGLVGDEPANYEKVSDYGSDMDAQMTRISPQASFYGVVPGSYPYFLNQLQNQMQVPVDYTPAQLHEFRQPLQNFQAMSKQFPHTDDFRRWSSYASLHNLVPAGKMDRSKMAEWE